MGEWNGSVRCGRCGRLDRAQQDRAALESVRRCPLGRSLGEPMIRSRHTHTHTHPSRFTPDHPPQQPKKAHTHRGPPPPTQPWRLLLLLLLAAAPVLERAGQCRVHAYVTQSSPAARRFSASRAVPHSRRALLASCRTCVLCRVGPRSCEYEASSSSDGRGSGAQ